MVQGIGSLGPDRLYFGLRAGCRPGGAGDPLRIHGGDPFWDPLRSVPFQHRGDPGGLSGFLDLTRFSPPSGGEMGGPFPAIEKNGPMGRGTRGLDRHPQPAFSPPAFQFGQLRFCLTRIGFWDYAFWSWLCMIPALVVYVAGADALHLYLSQGKVPVTSRNDICFENQIARQARHMLNDNAIPFDQ